MTDILEQSILNVFILYSLSKKKLVANDLYNIMQEKVPYLNLNQSVIYSHLYQLEAINLVDNTWLINQKINMPMKHYHITKKGNATLLAQIGELKDIVNSLQELI
ncbi:helix-turn-helix transcriptional regulator [Clostridiaceae bacterium M8S5]|nr:helix-turn-helix transcriptional regulator [Clostridiaceae bacterium M8S5]